MTELNIRIQETGAEVTARKMKQLRSSTKEVKDEFALSKKEIAEVDAAIASLGGSASSNSSKINGLNGNIGGLTNNLERATGIFKGLSPELQSASGMFGNLSTGITSSTAAMGPWGLAIGLAIGLLPELISLISNWGENVEDLNVNLDENVRFLGEQERAVIQLANRISAAQQQVRAISAGRHQQSILAEGLGTVEEHQAYVNESRRQMTVLEESLSQYLLSIDESKREAAREAALTGAIFTRQGEAVAIAVGRGGAAVLETYARQTREIQEEIERRNELLRTAQEEQEFENARAADEAMGPSINDQRTPSSRAARVDHEQIKQREALEKQINAVLGDRNALFEEGLALSIDTILAAQEGFDIATADRDFRQTMVDLMVEQNSLTIEQLMLLEEEKIQNEELGIIKVKNIEAEKLAREQAMKAQGAAEAELTKARQKQERIVSSGLQEVANLTQMATALAEQEGITRAEAWQTAFKEWSKTFALEQAFKGVEAGLNAIGAAARYDYSAAAQYGVQAAGHVALAAVVGGIGAAIPSAGGGEAPTERDNRNPQFEAEVQPLVVNVSGQLVGDVAQLGRVVRNALDEEERRY